MRVNIQIFGEGEYETDTLSSRIVDVRVDELKEEFERNDVRVNLSKDDSKRNPDEPMLFSFFWNYGYQIGPVAELWSEEKLRRTITFDENNKEKILALGLNETLILAGIIEVFKAWRVQ